MHTEPFLLATRTRRDSRPHDNSVIINKCCTSTPNAASSLLRRCPSFPNLFNDLYQGESRVLNRSATDLESEYPGLPIILVSPGLKRAV